MKKLALVAAAMLTFAIPAAEAQYRQDGPRHGYQQRHVAPHHARPAVRHAPPRVQRHRWARGQHYRDWRRHSAVRDYHRHGLRRPARGQHWVKVNNDYLLVATATGLIAAIVAGR